MARHPADVMATLTLRVPRGQQGFWEIIRDLHRRKKTWSVADIDGASNVAPATVRDFVQRLLKAGYIARAGAKKFRLVKDQPSAPRLKRDGSPAKEPGVGQDQMWRAMKMMKDFDKRELALAASTEGHRVSVIAAKDYIQNLDRAGYLILLAGAIPGRAAIWRLKPAMNTGPLAPQVQRTSYIYDPNRRVVMPMRERP